MQIFLNYFILKNQVAKIVPQIVEIEWIQWKQRESSMNKIKEGSMENLHLFYTCTPVSVFDDTLS